MTARSVLGAARRRILSSVYRRPALRSSGDPIVSFTFDDFPRTAGSAGASILERFGARGTFYTACGLMNTANDSGEQFRAEDLDSLLENGHEIASHTFHHVSARAISCAAFCEDVKQGIEAVREAAGGESANFAYPFGHVTVQSKRALAQSLTSARSIIPGFNGTEIDLNLLRANSLYGGLEAARQAEELIAENVRRRSWLIFYTHDVQPSPSAYGCTPALLEAAVACAARSGCRILTVQEALAEAGVQNGNPKGQARRPVSA